MTVTQQIALNYTPRPWTLPVHAMMAKKRFVACRAHRRAGKTVLAVAATAMSALAYPNTRYAYVAPTQVQAKAVAWNLYKTIFAPFGDMVQFREAELRIILPQGSEIMLLSAEHHDRARGLGLHGMVADEVANWPISAWFESFRPTLSGTGGWALFIGTPRGADLFAELCAYAASGADPDWAELAFPAWPENTTGVLPDSEIEAARREALTEATFLREYGVRLDVSAEDQLIKLEDVLACQHRGQGANARTIHNSTMWTEPRIMGIDCGGPGADGDNSVAVMRHGPIILDPEVTTSKDYHLLPGRVAIAARAFKPDAIFVDGTGGWALGLIPALQAMGFSPIPVNFGSSALAEKQFANRRAEMAAALAEWTKRPNSVLPSGQRLAADLTATRYKHDAKGRVILEPKADVRKRLGRSPDLHDACALTFAAPVIAQRRDGAPDGPRAGGDRYQSDYRKMMPPEPGRYRYELEDGSRRFDPFSH